MDFSPATGRVSRWMAVGAAALLPFAVTACGGDTAGPETGTDVEDVTEEDYFGNDEYIGETVTVSAEVTEVFSPTSFQLAGEDWGDESLLVTSANEVRNLRPGTVVRVTGQVRQFDYEQYADQYGLGDAERYDPFDNEEFLAATNVDTNVGNGGTGTPSPSPS